MSLIAADPPRVFGVEPNKGDTAGGTYVHISGERFPTDPPRTAKVYFGAQKGTFVRMTDTQIVVEAPTSKAGETVDVLVILEPGGEFKLPHAFSFVEASPPP